MRGLRRMMYRLLFALVAGLFVNGRAGELSLSSPDGRTQVIIRIGPTITYAVRHDGREIVSPSRISLTLGDGTVLGRGSKLLRTSRQEIHQIIRPVVREKSAEVVDHCRELTLHFREGFSVIFRAYNDGVAYRFVTRLPGEIIVKNEEATFRFPMDCTTYFPEEESFVSHSERLYLHIPLSQIGPGRFCSLPALVEIPQGPKIAITESDLEDYPGMYLAGSAESPTCLVGLFPRYVLQDSALNDRDIVPTRRADFLARTRGERAFPWRVLVIADRDGDLVESQMVYKLARPLELDDTSWIKPGKVAWDWWNALNVYGVDFRAGVNTATYKYYIDFAARYGIEYVILDEGWYKLGNLLEVNPEIDMDELTAYARQKNVGLILWVVWKTLESQMEEALDQFERWGIKGIKVDFMQRDDQEVVNFYWRVAREAARRRMIVDFHGSHKPTGLRRAYPNVLTREGVRGLEWSKWSDGASPDNAVTLPFIRMLAGPMDYTPGAMWNATRDQFRPIFTLPMSQGTRCHQLAMYVVYESPLQMLADSPTHYLREPECMEFLAKVPTVWDETRVLDARVAEYIVIARRHGAEWWVGAMTNWTPRDLVVDFSFLGKGTYQMYAYQDGINADRCAMDYKRVAKTIDSGHREAIHLAPGGGWAARIVPVKP
ncbi:MAG: glycoside hydrolase family 97 protein [candidate division KSB1 bacterium]|nr:glycoside hydrolase family 97 protein [candidate division KSB1 bacterium]